MAKWECCSVRHQGNKAIVDFFALGDMAGYRSEAAGHFNLFIAYLGAVITGGVYFFERAIQPGRRIDNAF